MSAILRVYGSKFDVDSCLVSCTLPICAVKRKGEPVFPESQSGCRQLETSGIHVVVSEAGFDEFTRQVEEAADFLQENEAEFRGLVKFPGVESATLDFGIARRDVAVQSDLIPLKLIRIANSLGLDLELSQYPISE